MINYNRLILFLIVSIALHILLIYLLPNYNITFKPPKPEIINIEILKEKAFVKKEKKKSKQKPKQLLTKKNIEKLKEKLKKLKTKKRKNLKEDIEIPKMETKEYIPTPKINEKDISLENEQPKENKELLNKELKNLKNELAKENNPTTQEKIQSSDFYEIKSISNIKRKIVYEPAKPVFSLEKDTKVTLSFKVDKYGIPYDITLITRSSANIEKIAVDFVKNLRFDAVDYDTPDRVEITLYFKVE